MKTASNPGLLDHMDDQGDEVDNQSVEGTDHGDTKASADDRKAHIPKHLQGAEHLVQAAKGPEDGKNQCSKADFLHPFGRFPSCGDSGVYDCNCLMPECHIPRWCRRGDQRGNTIFNLYKAKIVLIFAKKMNMRFEDILHDGRLWAVVYDGDEQDILTKTFENWLDPGFLEDFFCKNINDLKTYFHITNLDIAIYDTIEDAASLSCLMLDLRPDANLDCIFRPLENQRIHEMLLSREKAKGKRMPAHSSWLRIYAIKLGQGIYLVTGGTIKLTHLMAEREHTLNELKRMEMVRDYLLDNGIIDVDGIKEDAL